MSYNQVTTNFKTIQETMPRLRTASEAGDHAVWTARVPVASGRLALNYDARFADKNKVDYRATFSAACDGAHLAISFGDVTYLPTGEQIKPGIVRRKGFGDEGPDEVTFLPPEIVEGFVVKAVRTSGLVEVYGVINGVEEALPGITDHRLLSLQILNVCGWAIKSHPNDPQKFAVPAASQSIPAFV